MHIKQILLILAFLCYVPHNSVYANPAIFQKDYNTASKIANELKQDMILIFTASWCGPCQNLKRDLTKYVDYFEDTTICIVDIDEQPQLARKYGVNKVPYSIFYSKGKKIKSVVGYSNIDKFRK